MKPIQIFITGGTLDKAYHEQTGTLYFPNSHLPQMLKEARLQRPFEITVLMQKDSLDMTQADRETLLTACQNSPAEQILITHGTDTMVNTAQFLQQAINFSEPSNHKTIILTGAMRPYSFSQSDALFNLGTAFGFFAKNPSPAGVFIAMNGQIFSANKVQKNQQAGIFEAID